MDNFFYKIKNNPVASFLTFFTAVLLLTNFFLVYFKVDNLSYPLVINFFGIQSSGLFQNSLDLWGILAMEGIFLFFNFLLAFYIYYRERILTYLVLFSNVIVAIIGLIVSANIISLN
ncbi:MAG: hypothetical protein ABEI53_00800 [Candidatus Magasanikbacteria bacterium]